MKVFSLTGKSGTGKSYQAVNLCKSLQIPALIDDGLFIYKNKIEAGFSAKKEQTKLGAIKNAVFSKEEHRKSVASRIAELNLEKILILGTSDEMTDKICERLGLPPVSERIHIEDITTPEERARADSQRNKYGKHVIPVPTMQIKKSFAGYFVKPLKIFNNGKKDARDLSEKTVVRPTYSYIGNFVLSENVIRDIIRCVAKESPGISKVFSVYENTEPEHLCVTVVCEVYKGINVWENLERFQNLLIEKIEQMTAFNVSKVDVTVNAIKERTIFI